MKKGLTQDGVIFSVGGLIYCAIEILWRGYTHWSMLITGGCCCIALVRVFNKISNFKIYSKCIIGSGIITTIEFLSGCIVNIWLKLDVWDYSDMPFNLLGQICPIYSIFWAILSIPIIKVCPILSGKTFMNKKQKN